MLLRPTADHRGPLEVFFQLEKLRPGESATRTIYSRPVGSGVSLASHSPCTNPLCPPNTKVLLFCVHYFPLLTLLFGQRHKTQPLRFYRMRQGQRCGEGTRDAQERTVSVSNPASLIRRCLAQNTAVNHLAGCLCLHSYSDTK